MYWDTLLLTCKQKQTEFYSCTRSNQCLGPMNCTNGVCECQSYEYFNSTDLKCQPKTLYSTQCKMSRTCRTDLGLICDNNICIRIYI